MAETARRSQERGGFSERMRGWLGGAGTDPVSGNDGLDEIEEIPFGPPGFLSEAQAGGDELPPEAAEALEQAMLGGLREPDRAPSPLERQTEAEMFSDSELFMEACEKFRMASEAFYDAGELLRKFAERQAVPSPDVRGAGKEPRAE